MKFDLGIRVGSAVTMNDARDVIPDAFVGITKGEIAFIAPYKSSLTKMCRKFESHPQFVMIPGLVNAHAHLAMTLFRGMVDDLPLKEWLFQKVLPLEAKFVSKKFVEVGTSLAALECLRFGTTTSSDMYFYLEGAMKVWGKRGLRGVFFQSIADGVLPEDQDLGSDARLKLNRIEKTFKNSELLTWGLGPHAPYTCSDSTLTKAAQLAREKNLPLQIHLAEGPFETDESMKKYGVSPTRRLFDLGVLGPRTSCAHSIHLSEDDRRLLQKTGTSTVHCPDSNTKLGSGISPVADLRARGINVALGTDGPASNNDLSLFGAMDLSAKLQKVASGNPQTLPAMDVLWMATRGGAKALQLDAKIGSLEVGKKADLVLIDFGFPHLSPVHDPVSHLVYSCQGLEVDTVIVNGKKLMHGKKLPRDAEKVLQQAQKIRTQMHRYLEKV